MSPTCTRSNSERVCIIIYIYIYTRRTIHTSYVTKCSVLCVGHFSYSYGSNCQRGMPAQECERDWRASETVKLGAERLCVRRECDRTRHGSKEEREAALLRMRACSRSRVASETADERQATVTYETRLAAKPTNDRQARLQRFCTCVCRLKRMALPQARPTMLCIH